MSYSERANNQLHIASDILENNILPDEQWFKREKVMICLGYRLALALINTLLAISTEISELPKER